MDRFTRILSLHKIFASRRTPISRHELEEKLESNRSTVKRTIEDMRDHLAAPIIYDRTSNGYYYDQKHSEHPWEIPGLWFNADELFALLTTHKLLSDIQPGLLDDTISAFKHRIESLLQNKNLGSREISKRVRILQVKARQPGIEYFRKLTTALVHRRRVSVVYHGREQDKLTERLISPQRLVYYRDNWYLDAWCHLRKGLRTFSLDRLRPIKVETSKTRELTDKELDKHFTKTFGIFSGSVKEIAKLRFTPEAAKWAADENWHPEQQGKVLPDGRYELNIPYGNPTELLQDIMKYGPDVEVLAPKSLRQQLAENLKKACAQYT
ncbi:MAG: helix-turn-helix transcriptional regulator [Pseudohongiellaceae bacterium]